LPVEIPHHHREEDRGEARLKVIERVAEADKPDGKPLFGLARFRLCFSLRADRQGFGFLRVVHRSVVFRLVSFYRPVSTDVNAPGDRIFLLTISA